MLSSDADSVQRVDALHGLRSLSEARQEAADADDVAAFCAVKELLRADLSPGPEMTASCMALHALSCRLGLSYCATQEMFDLVTSVCKSNTTALSAGADRTSVVSVSAAQVLFVQLPFATQCLIASMSAAV